MTQSEVLQFVKKELNLSDAQYEKYTKDIEGVMELLKREHVTFQEDNLLAFISHVFTLFMRLETGEKVNGMSEEVLSQLDEEALRITNEMMEQVAKTYGKADVAEVILVAIHIQTALELMNE